MHDALITRHSRHLLLDQFGFEAQDRVSLANMLIVGAGGLGSPALLFLTASGVGQLSIYDHDRVDETNLARQVLYCESDIGEFKAEAAKRRLRGLNSNVRVKAYSRRLEGEELTRTVAEHDVIIDCTDNFSARLQLDAACRAWRKPLVSGAAVRFQAYVTVFDFRDPAQGCLRCALGDVLQVEPTACATMGVFGPMVGVIGSLIASEALKLTGQVGTSLISRISTFDALESRWFEVAFDRDPTCPACAAL
jgi:molybdopterin/thiamine biosynthesis adenylyltransferase